MVHRVQSGWLPLRSLPCQSPTTSQDNSPLDQRSHAMFRTIGHLLQLFGLLILPLAVVLELSGSLGRDTGVSELVIMLVAGSAAFVLGRVIEGYAAK